MEERIVERTNTEDCVQKKILKGVDILIKDNNDALKLVECTAGGC